MKVLCSWSRKSSCIRFHRARRTVVTGEIKRQISFWHSRQTLVNKCLIINTMMRSWTFFFISLSKMSLVELQIGTWTSQHGTAECEWFPMVPSSTWNWKTKFQVNSLPTVLLKLILVLPSNQCLIVRDTLSCVSKTTTEDRLSSV